MNVTKEYLRGLLLYDFKSGISAAESSRRIKNAFGDGVMSERSAQEWFKRFRSGDESVTDHERSGRPSTVDDDKMVAAVKQNPHLTTRELADDLGVHHSTVADHLKALGYKSKLDVWVPHKLTDNQKERRCEAAMSLLSFRRRDDWLDTIVTGDEKWCLYINIKRRRSWLAAGDGPQHCARGEMHPKKSHAMHLVG